MTLSYVGTCPETLDWEQTKYVTFESICDVKYCFVHPILHPCACAIIARHSGRRKWASIKPDHFDPAQTVNDQAHVSLPRWWVVP
jgi:hypothetical protein